LKLPLFPLSTVLFPDGVLPLRIFEARYIDMVRGCLKSKTQFGVVLIKSGSETGRDTAVELTGTAADITAADMNEPGIINISTLGRQRFTVLEAERAKDGLLMGEVKWLPQAPAVTLDPKYAACSVLLANIVEQLEGDTKNAPAVGQRFSTPLKISDTAWVADRLIEILPVPAIAKQKLLEMEDPESRMQVVFAYLLQKGVVGGTAEA
jgi:uncharacterized protein